MKWLGNWMYKLIHQAQENQLVTLRPPISSNHNIDSDATMTFTVYTAIGGKVVEFRRYNRQRDSSEHTMYVIGSDEDFGSCIAKIATLETLKN
jgi:hypothetical protein